ncbi:DUF6304 family protein [Nocardia sp. NPDC004340]|uniref:DUF6304 family protein n=1 Tax=Nocardia sp. CA-136227 TaxID=3239979 RepID=UPI003D976D0F
MRAWSFPGSYEDGRGRVAIKWRIEPYEVAGWAGGYEISTVVRGIPLSGGDLDCIEPDPPDPRAREALSLDDRFDALTRCRLTGELPCTVVVSGVRRAEVVRFTLDLTPDTQRDKLRLSLTLNGATYETDCHAFETGLQELIAALPEGTSLVCCYTCLYADYSPVSGPIMGMRCYREAKEQYLAVRTEPDIWNVPATEAVPETYLCSQYRVRIPGTGYRG